MKSVYTDILKNVNASNFMDIINEIESVSLAKFYVPFMYVDYLYRNENEILLVKYFLALDEELRQSWVADEEGIDGGIPRYFSEESHIESPVYFLYRSRKLIEDCVYQGKTYSIHLLLVCNCDIINYEDMLPVWNDMGITVVRQCDLYWDTLSVELLTTFYSQPDGSRVEFLEKEELNGEMLDFYNEFVLNLALSHEDAEKDMDDTPSDNIDDLEDEDSDDLDFDDFIEEETDYSDNKPVNEWPVPYTRCFKLLSFALYRLDDLFMDYSEVILNNVSLTLFNRDKLFRILMVLYAENLLEKDYDFPFKIKMFNELGQEVIDDCLEADVVREGENKVLQLMYPLSVPVWEKGMYLVEDLIETEVLKHRYNNFIYKITNAISDLID